MHGFVVGGVVVLHDKVDGGARIREKRERTIIICSNIETVVIGAWDLREGGCQRNGIGCLLLC